MGLDPHMSPCPANWTRYSEAMHVLGVHILILWDVQYCKLHQAGLSRFGSADRPPK